MNILSMAFFGIIYSPQNTQPFEKKKHGHIDRMRWDDLPNHRSYAMAAMRPDQFLHLAFQLRFRILQAFQFLADISCYPGIAIAPLIRKIKASPQKKFTHEKITP